MDSADSSISSSPALTHIAVQLDRINLALWQQLDTTASLAQQIARLTTTIERHFYASPLADTTAVSSPSARALSPSRDPPILKPETFDGDVTKCHAFLLQCQRLFDQQPQTFRSDRVKINYVINRLRGKALTWAEAADAQGQL